MCNFMVISLLPAHPSETIRRCPEVDRPHALTQLFFVLVVIVDTMRLYGIQSPDPVALTCFSGIIRPLSIMFYAAKEDMAFVSGNARRQVTSGIFASSNASGGHSCVH